ncbi:sodium- and chloride-dependent glycine transporter 2-like isoform X2 [Gigantopelta aegis]|uniref:sodium- and chloride-dependent glycine transporter 2-like isoform X2 n=1 Tax=Gigantopelta aegis TaxID=1735272 RepID=UPI001B88AD64|nr:sodium- and chloride-dependent glycine transporter 2-like isoform X2 [Gigantopelta aegis]
MAAKNSYNLWGDLPPGQKVVTDIYQQRNDERSEDTATDTETTGEEYERGQWGNKAEFILSCIGLSVGLGNVWRFPYLAYENGGAAFVIAYLVLQLLIGKPMYFMELAVGQFSAKGPTAIWHMNPSAKGVGIAMAVISLDVAIFYNVIMAYTLYYFFASMQTTLPWTVCKEGWENCVTTRVAPPAFCTGNATYDALLDACRCTGNYSIDSILTVNCTNLTYTGKPITASEHFFFREVIQRSSGLEPENFGYPSWKLLLCLVLSWVVVVLCLIKGVKSSGKVVYFTATFPYVILIILLIRGSLLEGAIDGVIYFIVPKWEKLLDLKVWSAAAGQMFFSLSVSFGGIIMFGSYNKFKNNVYADALLISIMDLVTSIIAGFVIFTTFGGMAHKAGTTVAEVAKAGYGLAFVAYPEALSNFPIPQLWSVIFFFMLFTLGLDSEFGLMETVLTCIQDEFPKLRKYKSIMCVVLGVICFVLALPCICPGGDYVVSIMADYGADFSVLVVASCECVGIMWVYGVRKFLKDVEYMLGKKPSVWPYWVFCWAVISPLGITLMFVYRMVQYKPHTVGFFLFQLMFVYRMVQYKPHTVGFFLFQLMFVYRMVQYKPHMVGLFVTAHVCVQDGPIQATYDVFLFQLMFVYRMV